jgi:GGDEF domain-containing protein
MRERPRFDHRRVDVLGRLGGEEFAIILPEAGPDGAMMTAERLRAPFATEPVAFAGHAIPGDRQFRRGDVG